MYVINPPKNAPDYQLKFAEDFDRLDLNVTRDPTSKAVWTEGVWFYAPNPQADISVRNSVLRLRWHCGQNDTIDVSGMVGFRYGYFEARMASTPKVGMSPAFWFIPQEGYNPGVARTAELD